MVLFTDAHFWQMKALVNQNFKCVEIARCLGLGEKRSRVLLQWKKRNVPPSEVRRRKSKRVVAPHVVARRAEVRRLVSIVSSIKQERMTPKRQKRVERVFKRVPYGTAPRLCRKLNLDRKAKKGVPARDRRPVSVATIRRDLHAIDHVPRVRRRGPRLEEHHKVARVNFCKWWLSFRPSERPLLIFTDEKSLGCNDNGDRIQWVPKGTQPLPKEHQQSGGPEKVWFWGAITAGADEPFFLTLPKGTIKQCDYREKILSAALPHLKRMCKGNRLVCFMNDGARPHLHAYEWLRKRGVRCLSVDWPPMSCDLNCIEQVWQRLQHEVSLLAPFGEQHLRQFGMEFLSKKENRPWFKSLCDSFESRCLKVVAAGGELIKP